ncbi:MAG TPA: signal peptidase I [Thermoanaerobaculia bacterium]|nr:signal peptidase I [Thermoanaerobaculia bacterium]
MQTEKSVSREYLEALLIAVIFATFARTFIVQAFKIPSGSMEQNLLIGDHILVNKFVYGPTLSPLESRLLPVRPVRRGDIVVFKFPKDPERDFIKRCVGLPGDSVEILDKRLFLNGRVVHDEGYTYHTDERVLPRSALASDFSNRDNFGPRVVPPGHYFCMGDNRDNSNDSRFWGEVPEANLKGRAFMIYWSFDTGEGESPDGPGLSGKLRQLGQVGLKFFARTRWARTLRIVR